MYYLRAEGEFMYYYIVSCGVAFLVCAAIACCLGSVCFMIGSFTALNFVLSMVDNIDNLPEFMREGAAGDKYKKHKN